MVSLLRQRCVQAAFAPFSLRIVQSLRVGATAFRFTVCSGLAVLGLAPREVRASFSAALTGSREAEGLGVCGLVCEVRRKVSTAKGRAGVSVLPT